MAETGATVRDDPSAEASVEPKSGRIWLTLAAAWAVPGLGHLLLGRTRRAILFAAIVWGAYGLGLVHSGSLALKDAKQPFLTTLQIVANLGVGPVDLLARTAVYGGPVYTLKDSIRGDHEATRVYRERIRSELSIYGTAYLWTAGLMNLLLLFDVWDIGRGRKE